MTQELAFVSCVQRKGLTTTSKTQLRENQHASCTDRNVRRREPPAVVRLLCFGLLASAELGSASARGNEDSFALRLFGRCGLQVRFEG